MYELLEFDHRLTDALVVGDSLAFARLAKSAKGFTPLNMVALQYAIEGVTTMEEVLRISADIDVYLEDDPLQSSGETVV